MAAANDLAGLCVRRPYLAAVLNLLIIVAGLSALLGVEVRELPDIDQPVVMIRANMPGASPETIDAQVTSVLESAVARVNGITEVRSSSEENNMRIRVYFNPSVDLVDAANDVREAVSRVEAWLPDDAEDIVVIKADNDANAIIQLAVSSDRLAIEDVTLLTEDEIVPALTSIAGVADVRLSGQRQRVLRVVVDPMRLARYRLSIADVSEVLRGARYDVPAGSFKSDDQEIIVRADASANDPKAIEALVLREDVTLGDVATAFFGPAKQESLVRLNGRPIINLGIVRRAQSNTVAISQDVEKVVARLSTRLNDVNITTTTDDAIFIRGAIIEVLTSLAIAVAIVVGVIAVFVGRIRTALIPAVAIPVALIGTVSCIWLFGFSLNLLTLLALVLAAGLVVDDAIVVLENIQRMRAQGKSARAAAVLGTRQVFFAVVATTAVLASVFVPISFLPSSAGRLFAEFGFVLAVSVMISSFVALSLCPMLASRLPDEPVPTETSGGVLGLIGGILQGVYAVLLKGVLAAPLVVVGASILIGVFGAIVYETLGEELVPQEDRGKITVRLTGPDGTGIDYIDRQVERVEEIIKPWVDDGTITWVSTISGRYDPNRGQVDAPLRDWSERKVSETELTEELNRQLAEIPGAQVRISRGNSLNLRGAGEGIKFALTGADYEKILAAANSFVLSMEENLPYLQNFRVEFRATQPQIALGIDRRRASDLGVPIESLAATVAALVDEDKIAELTVNDQTVPIILKAIDGAVDDPSDLNNLYVSASDGRIVPLSQIVTFTERPVAAELDRHGQRRAIEIAADRVNDATLRQAVDGVRALADKDLPEGIGLLMLDEAASLDETSHGVLATYLIAMAIVFLVLLAQFESITSTTVVILTVPFGVCAAIFALALTGTTINVYSQIGVLLLIGIMAKNAILMVEFADQLREDGRNVLQAAREASVVRLRPICMTMISTILAGLPLIMSSGPGAEARAAIGWVVVGGLGLSAIITLFLTPALYVLIAPFSQPRNAAGKRLEDELEQAAG